MDDSGPGRSVWFVGDLDDPWVAAIAGPDLALAGVQRCRHQVRRQEAGQVRLAREHVVPQLPADADAEMMAPGALAVADGGQQVQVSAPRQARLGGLLCRAGDAEAAVHVGRVVGGSGVRTPNSCSLISNHVSSGLELGIARSSFVPRTFVTGIDRPSASGLLSEPTRPSNSSGLS